MYVIVKNIENSKFEHFSMLASNGTYTDGDLTKAVEYGVAGTATAGALGAKGAEGILNSAGGIRKQLRKV